MNNIWSKYIQGINVLYFSRKLRFNDMFKKQYQELFKLDRDKPLRILEIGCGPGALAGTLHRWYPNADITAIDRDSDFISFANKNEKGVHFLEGDATSLPFDDNTFDVTISNTVAEHIEPSAFYKEQLRVLKPNGVCLVMSTRKGISVNPSCVTFNEFEKNFWEKAASYDTAIKDYNICKYPMTEAEIPGAMAKCGFCSISTGYVTVNLTPDDPDIHKELAHEMINSARETALDSIIRIANTIPERFTEEELETMLNLTNEKYDLRLRLYDDGNKQWDTNVSIIMIIRGVK